MKKKNSDSGKWIAMGLVMFILWYVATGLFPFTILMFYGLWNETVWFYVSASLLIILSFWLPQFFVAYKMAPKYGKIIGICAAIVTSLFPIYVTCLG